MLFYIIAFILGLFGAVADIALSHWSKTYSLQWWLGAGVLFLIFMTGFGIVMKMGDIRQYSLSIVVLIVLLTNVIGVVVWDLAVRHVHLTPTQWVGIVLGAAAIACIEIGRA